MCLVRVHANRDSRFGPQLVEAPCLRRLARVAGFENHERPLQSSGFGALDNGRQIMSKKLVSEMAMAIDHNRCEEGTLSSVESSESRGGG